MGTEDQLSLMLTNREGLVEEMDVAGTVGGNDHVMLKFLCLKQTKSSKTCIMGINKDNFNTTATIDWPV